MCKLIYAVLTDESDGYTFSCNNCLEGLFTTYEKAEKYITEYIKKFNEGYLQARPSETEKDVWILSPEDHIIKIDIIEVDKEYE